MSSLYRETLQERRAINAGELVESDSVILDVRISMETFPASVRLLAGTLAKGRRPRDVQEALAAIKTSSPFETRGDFEWFERISREYPAISRYLETGDYLRLLIMEYLAEIDRS